MEPIKHPNANHRLLPPEGWNEEANGECAVLECFASVEGDDIVIQSCWQPNDDERAALAVGMPVVLFVYGTRIPPMAVGVLAPPEDMLTAASKGEAEPVAWVRTPDLYNKSVDAPVMFYPPGYGWTPLYTSAIAGAGEEWPKGESPEDRFEHYVATAIAKSPEPLRQLGEWLSNVLDEDQWKTADRYLLQLATEYHPPLASAEGWPKKYGDGNVPEGWAGLSSYENGWNAAIEACRLVAVSKAPQVAPEQPAGLAVDIAAKISVEDFPDVNSALILEVVQKTLQESRARWKP